MEIKTAKGKECSKCKKFKALKYFYKNSKSKDGYRSDCKDCAKKQHKEIRSKIIYINKTEKICSECGRTLPIERFGIDKTKKDYHRSYCLECMSEQHKHRNRINIVKSPRSKL